MAGITNCEITKYGDPLYCYSTYTPWLSESFDLVIRLIAVGKHIY